MKALTFFALIFLFLILSSKQALALDDVIRVAGYSLTAAKVPLTKINLTPPLAQFYANRLSGLIKRASNFGPSGVVSCSVEILDQVSYVESGSLVDENGDLTAEIFFGGAKKTNLTDEEASELAKFVVNGGVLYVTGGGWLTPTTGMGPEYNLLFEKLSLRDKFKTDHFTSGEYAQTSVPLESPITRGPFGTVGSLAVDSIRRFDTQDMIGIASKTEVEEFVVHEKKLGSGYLIVTGSFLYADLLLDLDNDNETYYLNLFALGCGEQDFGKYEKVVLPVPSFKQGLTPYDNDDPYWEDVTYDDGNNLDLWCDFDDNGAKMYECACALTSATMVMNYFGVTKTPIGTELNPAFLNFYAEEILPNGGYSGFIGGNFRWDFVGNFSKTINGAFPAQPKIEQPVRENFSVDRVKELIDNGKPVILRVNNGSHWVVVKGYNPDTNRLIINDPVRPDPGSGEYTYLDDYYSADLAGSMIIYETTNSDYRYLQLTTTSQNQLLVEDELGNKTGYDPDSGQIVKKIPNSDYALDPYYSSPVLDGSTPTSDGVYFLTVKLPEDGEFDLQIMNQDGGNYPVHVYSSDTEGGLAGKALEPGSTGNKYNFEYDTETAGQQINVSIPAQIDITPFIDNNVIIPHKWIPTSVAILASDTFDVEKVDRNSLTFGKTGDEESLTSCIRRLIDVNRDGAHDLVCYFASDKTGLDTGDTEAKLKGMYDGFPFFGTDTVQVFKPWFLF